MFSLMDACGLSGRKLERKGEKSPRFPAFCFSEETSTASLCLTFSMIPFSHIAVLGPGVLGGSLALALPEVLPVQGNVRLWGRRAEAVTEAKLRGVVHASTDLAEVVQGADLLILAVPVGVMPSLLKQAVEAGLPKDCLITDVGSVKGLPHAQLEPVAAHFGLCFLGSHPMAGSEQTGMSAAKADLFKGAACILTSRECAQGDDERKLEKFWQILGCDTSWATPERHDEIVARISHFPRIAAASVAKVALQEPEIGRFVGNGLRDTTRVASGSPDMWREILLENREAVIPPVREMIDSLREMLALLEANDEEKLRAWLAEAKDLRDALRRSP